VRVCYCVSAVCERAVRVCHFPIRRTEQPNKAQRRPATVRELTHSYFHTNSRCIPGFCCKSSLCCRRSPVAVRLRASPVATSAPRRRRAAAGAVAHRAQYFSHAHTLNSVPTSSSRPRAAHLTGPTTVPQEQQAHAPTSHHPRSSPNLGQQEQQAHAPTCSLVPQTSLDACWPQHGLTGWTQARGRPAQSDSRSRPAALSTQRTRLVSTRLAYAGKHTHLQPNVHACALIVSSDQPRPAA